MLRYARPLGLLAWKLILRRLAEDRPAPSEAMRLLREAEFWPRRLHLMREQQLRLLRWHAISSRG